MRKVILVFFVFATTAVSAQKKKDWSKVELDKAGDHIMLQISSDHWANVPDSISSHIKGFSRGLNLAVMLNKPFKSDPRWSVALGLGVSSSAIFFKKMGVDLKSTNGTLPFINQDSLNHFKKYRLVTTYLEIPIELRYTFHPEAEKKSVKLAAGVKIGTMINAHTKGKTLQDEYGTTVGSYTEKTSKRTFFNSTRLAATARIGMGNFSIFGAYQLNAFFKDGAGPTDIRPFQFGICLSGL